MLVGLLGCLLFDHFGDQPIATPPRSKLTRYKRPSQPAKVREDARARKDLQRAFA